MTEEEQEKEAEQYAVENWEHYEEGQTDYKALKQAYLDSAEPREKRIAELETRCNELFLQTMQLTKAKELLKQWLQTSKASGCDNINIVTDTEQFLSEVKK